MLTETKIDAVERLLDIKDEIKSLMEEALEIVSEHSEHECRVATSYWYAHVVGALDSEHHYLGGSMMTMQDSINGLEEDVIEDCDE